jgi:thiol-disulfide isomerase/thioredoxin
MSFNKPVFHRTSTCGLIVLLTSLLAVVGCHRGSQTEKSISLGKSDSVEVAQKTEKSTAAKSDSAADVKTGKTSAPDKPAPKKNEKDPSLPRNPDPELKQPEKVDPKPEEPLDNDRDEGPPFRRIPAPSLEGGISWINTASSLELRQLRGKFVLLDFWTYCCINCIHVLPEIKKLEKAYPNELVVIGVHSAKFAGEKDSANITDAVMRYEIEHPVVNDAEHAIWNRYGVRSWPSMAMIDPEGQLFWMDSGEHKFEDLDRLLKHVMPYYEKKGLIDRQPIRFDLAAHRAKATPLRYPGKVLADEAGDRLFISDSNHNRIVITKLDGTLIETIGTGQIGKADGNYATAQFHRPQGTAIIGQTLYVADTENHSLRKIDLVKKTVTTISGTGVQGRNAWPGHDARAFRFGEGKLPERFVGKPSETELNSPWALWVHKKDLYIAMAGPHQIWKMTLDEKEIGPYAGNGREDIVDGPLLPPEPYETGFSSFAQPSGLASDGTWLYVADSEGSSIRAVPFDPKEKVKTVIGTSELSGGRLFVFGDRDGKGLLRKKEGTLFFSGDADETDGPLLQHCLGVVFHRGQLYLTDTYNNKIKRLDPKTARCDTIAGSGKPAATDAEKGADAAFDEPEGLSAAAGKLYIADTNNHVIRVVDLDAGNKVSTLVIKGLEPPKPPASSPREKPTFPFAKTRQLDAVQVKVTGDELRLAAQLTLPEGYKLNPLAPMYYYVEAADKEGPVHRAALGRTIKLGQADLRFDMTLPLTKTTGSEELTVSLIYHYCREGAEGVCKVGSVIWKVPVTLSPDATATSVPLPYTVPGGDSAAKSLLPVFPKRNPDTKPDDDEPSDP